MPNSYAISWDDTGERYYELGVKHGVLFPRTGANGAYAAGVAWNGLTGVTESPSGADANVLWADNMKYATLRSVETFGGTIEAYTYPEEFEQCDGSASLATGVYAGQQSRVPFGFSYVTNVGDDTESDAENDNGYKIHLVYGATVNPSQRSYATINDSPDAITFSWEFETTPIAVEGKKPIAHIVIDSRTVDATKLGTFKQILYGTPAAGSTAAVDPRLPLPDEVITHFA